MENKAAAQVRRWTGASFAPRFEYGEMAQICVVTGSEHGTKLGTGLARFTNAEVPWQTKYDEVLLVLEGEVVVRTAGTELRAGPKDCIWLPAGSDLVYAAESALVFYAIEPADWADHAS